MRPSFTFTKPKWDIKEDKKVFETPIFSLNELTAGPPHKEFYSPFYVLEAPDWANVIALTPGKEIILVEQYRAGIHEPTLEIPGGISDKNESPLDSAKRELLEETGFSSGNWTSLGIVSSNPAIMTNHTHLYLAEDCSKTATPQTDSTEDIAVHLLPLNTFLNFVRKGIVHHSLVVAAVAQLLLKTDITEVD
ncbi:MAG: NUDIX hydrolase [Balneolaceae bacterium]